MAKRLDFATIGVSNPYQPRRQQLITQWVWVNWPKFARYHFTLAHQIGVYGILAVPNLLIRVL